MRKVLLSVAPIALGIAMFGCMGDKSQVSIKCDTFTLKNGLQVVLQQDHSDPVVAVAIQYHVGSAREKVGKTGFAHFFEHMLFQRSENLARNTFFQKINSLGGEFNGSTDSDGTRYHEIVPRDALEKVLWMESDRMGYFINTVTQGGLEREIDVVSNEKRQSYDTRPYGQLIPIMSRYAFPAEHPYSWTTIGELDDLRAATVDDVKEFYSKYYRPNNATLVISGDFDKVEAKALVEKYFAEIPAGEPVVAMGEKPAPLTGNVKVFHEDAYASMPLLTIIFPTVPSYHPDSYALNMLASIMADGKNSSLYKVIVDRKKLASEVQMGSYERELAGNMLIIIPAFEGINLNDIYAAVYEAFDLFEKEGFDEKIMDGYKALSEVNYYNSISGIMGRALHLANDNVFAGDPLRGFKDQELFRKVSKADVMRVYEKYIKGHNELQISLVPKGSEALAISGSSRAVVSEEKITDQTMKSEEGALVDDDYQRTVSAIDRSVEPGLLANTPQLSTPEIWKEQLSDDGFMMWGVTNSEMPLTRFSLTLNVGMLYDPQNKVGVASLYANTLFAGTQNKSPEELEDAFKRLGANVNCRAGIEGIFISGNCLSRNIKPVMELITEVITQPRFDSNEFDKERQSTLTNIAQQSDDAESIANVVSRKIMYPSGMLSNQVMGTAQSVAAITLDDLKAYHAAYISPAVANIHFAGSIKPADANKAVEKLKQEWKGKVVDVPAPENITPAMQPESRLYFIDQPGSQQSYIMVVSAAMPQTSPDYYSAYIANYRLGAGSHGLLFNELRLKRGYTYGAYSYFRCQNYDNLFLINTKVQGIKTKESVDAIKQLLEGYSAGYTSEEMEIMRASILKSNFGAYETLGALVGMLEDISAYSLPVDYVKQRETALRNITLEEIKGLADKYINPAGMTYIVVGDAATQFARLKECGLGDPVVLDKSGNAIK